MARPLPARNDEGMASPVPVLTDGVVTMRAHRPDDVDGMIAMGTDLETVRWTSVPVPYRRSHAEHWMQEVVPAGWRDGVSYGWAVEAEGRFAGNLDVRAGPPPDIGFATAPWARGRGFTARAVRLATRWAFETAGLHVVHWSANVGNLASWRVAHACGFTFHGERPLSVAQRDAVVDGWWASRQPDADPSPRTTWWPTPVLKGPGVRLRPHTEADVPRIVQACSDPRARHWLVPLPDPYTEQHARHYVREAALQASLGHRVAWAVTDASDRLLANIAIFRLDDPANPTGGEIGYWAHPDARGRGVVSDAVDLVVAHAFAPVAEGGLGRHRIQIGAAWGNAASRHVAERAGFTLVGHFRQDGVVGTGAVDDGAWYDRLATDAPQ
jgi:[ribosomal protein S5]-alanine N-acetyltransferase